MNSAFAPLLLEAALRALLAAMAVWAGLRALRVCNVVAQKAAWGLVLLAALALPFAPRWLVLTRMAALHLPALHWQQVDVAKPAAAQVAAPLPAAMPLSSADGPKTAAESVSQPADRSSAPSTGTEDFYPTVQIAPEPQPQTSASVSVPADGANAFSAASPDPAAVAWLLYLAVLAVLLARLLVGLASALRLWFTAEPVSALPGADGAPAASLRTSPRVSSPVNIGSGIVLPAGYADWEQEKLRVVLAHERSHVRQGDFYLQLIAGLYASLFWFSPLGWWLKRKLCELGEAISDRAGLEEAASRSSYAQLLLEFAALPRPTLTGVAMARTSHLSQRIERLLNESSFRQAFAAGGRRALLAVFFVPVALFAATALVRVEAAASPVVQDQAVPAAPEQMTAPAPAPMPAPMPQPSIDAEGPGPAPMAPQAPKAGVEGAPPVPPPPNMEAMPPEPPEPPVSLEIQPGAIRVNPDSIHVNIDPAMRAEIAAAREEARQARNYAYGFDGDPYAIVGDPGTKTRFSGSRNDGASDEIEKARKAAHGHFLWFRHEGKSYIVDDPAIVAQLEAMNKSVDEVGKQMRALGDQMRAAGEQQREIGRKMREASVPTPDLSKEMAELDAAFAGLKAKQGGTISQKDLGELQRQIGRIQGELGSLQGKIIAQQMNVDGGMGKFGGQMGKLGGQMGELGAKMGQLSRENHSKVEGIIDESLKDGKAKPVE